MGWLSKAPARELPGAPYVPFGALRYALRVMFCARIRCARPVWSLATVYRTGVARSGATPFCCRGTEHASRAALATAAFRRQFAIEACAEPVPSGASCNRGQQGHRLRRTACQSAHLIGSVGSRQDVCGLSGGSKHDRSQRPFIVILAWDQRIHVASGTCDLNARHEELPFGE